MPLKAKDVKAGTRDYCNLCGEVIVLKNPESSRYKHLVWFHLERDDRWCEGHPGEMNFRAVSRTYCGVSMDRSWYSDTCFRPIKDQERMMCGIHASHAIRSEKRAQEYHEKWDLNNYISEELQKLSLRFKEQFGLDIKAEYDMRNGTYTGNVVVNPVQLMDFLDSLSEEEDDDTEWEDANPL